MNTKICASMMAFAFLAIGSAMAAEGKVFEQLSGWAADSENRVSAVEARAIKAEQQAANAETRAMASEKALEKANKEQSRHC